MSTLRIVAGVLLLALQLPGADVEWGSPNNGLRIGATISPEPGRVLIVSFQNAGDEPTKFVLGGSTGNGPFYALTFEARNPEGHTCKIASTLGGAGVAGFLEPIVIKLDPSAIRTIEIPLAHLSCEEKGRASLGWMLVSGYSIKVGFAINARQASMAGPGKSWSGEVSSGLASIY